MSLDYKNLVERAIGGDDGAIEALVLDMESPLYRFLFHLCGSESLAQDLCQESFVKVLTSLSQLNDPTSFRSWMYRVGRNLFIDEMRKTRRIVFSEDQPKNDDEVPVVNEVSDDVLMIRKLLLQLSVEDREVLLLVDMEGHAYGEAGDIMGITESAVRSRLHRARKLLQQKLFQAEAA